MLNSTYKRGLKETVPEKVNVYLEPMTIGLKSVEDKHTYHCGLEQRFLTADKRVGSGLCTDTLELRLLPQERAIMYTACRS